MKINVKPALQKRTTILLNFILDESGSMAHQRDSVISGFNEYIETMRKNEEADYFVNLVKFGEKTEYVFTNKRLSDVRKLTRDDYNPQYSTALRDAIGNTTLLSERQLAESLHGASVLTYIFTDGEENASHEFTPKRIKEMIESRENKGGWTFSFIGASKACLEQASSWGIQAGNTITYTATNFSGAINNLCRSTATYASNVGSATSKGTVFTTASLFKEAGFDNTRNIDEQLNDTKSINIVTPTTTTNKP